MRGLKRSNKYKDYRKMESHLLQMRGLKLCSYQIAIRTCMVASFTDAWIETVYITWRTGVRKSHLLQMRGLKRTCFGLEMECGGKSHLLQMRGLKRTAGKPPYIPVTSHLLQMRGLKLVVDLNFPL